MRLPRLSRGRCVRGAMYLLIMVLDDAGSLNAVLEAWKQARVPGITILESTGLNRLLMRDEAHPMYLGFSQIFGSGRVGHHTLLAVIEGLDTAEAAVKATEAVIGSLDQPNTGIVVAVPVTKVWGLAEPYADEI